MSRATSVDEDGEAEPAADGSLLLGLLALQGWEIQVTPHDLGVEVVGRRDALEISWLGRSLAQVAVDFFEAVHEATRLRVATTRADRLEPDGRRVIEGTSS
jgi:hypothetical protein